MLTEQPNPNTHDIDRLGTLDMLTVINNEDQKVALAIREALPQIATAVDAIYARLRDGGRLIYIGAGTSGRLGILDAVECVPTYGVPAEMVQGVIAGGATALVHSIEGGEDNRENARKDLGAISLTPDDAVVGIAASGRTPYVLEAMAMAREIGAMTIGVACNVPSALLEAVDIPIGIVTGQEVVAGSTRMKAGTAQKMVLNMLSTSVMIKLGKVYGNLMVDVQATNEKLVMRARSLVMQITGVDSETATTLLAQAQGQVKTAVVMHKRGVDVEQARALLTAAHGRLREVIA